MEKNRKYTRIPMTVITVEPKLYSIIFIIESIRYLRVEVAYSLESAVHKISLLHKGSYITPGVQCSSME